MKFHTDFQRVKWQGSMNYLLSYQFRLNFRTSCIYHDVSSNFKDGSCCGGFFYTFKKYSAKFSYKKMK